MGPGVCAVCGGPAGVGGSVCFACRLASARLGLPLAPVLAASLCPLPGPLYSLLLTYKEAAVAEVRARAGRVVGDLLCEFVAGHRQCVASLLRGPATMVLPVPSTVRPGGSPLGGIEGVGGRLVEGLGDGQAMAPVWCPAALARDAGPLRHMAAHRDAFVVAEPAAGLVQGARVVLVDDTYVSGARAQSVAAALRRAGAARVVIVVVGRVIRPTVFPSHAALLAQSPERRDGVGASGRGGCARCVLGQAGEVTAAVSGAGSE